MKKLLVALILSFFPLFAGYTQVNGVWCKQAYAPEKSASEHFDEAMQLMNSNEYDEAIRNFIIVMQHYHDTVFYTDALFYAGVSYYHLGHYDLADEQFTRYLNQKGTLKHFEKVFDHKFSIAESYRAGKKRHPYGVASLPRIASGKRHAIELYDEIAATLPSRPIAAQSLFSKGLLLRKMKEKKESIEVFQTLTRRFPKHPLAADAYEQIAQIYVDNVRREAQNPDMLALAKLNYQSFEKSFPSDERVAVLDGHLREMKEMYAESLFQTGRFYEKKKKSNAALIYFHETIAKYPNTLAARESQVRIERIEQK